MMTKPCIMHTMTATSLSFSAGHTSALNWSSCCYNFVGNAGDDEEAMYGVTGAVERDIDELFEDSGSGDEGQDRPAVTGVSRSGRMRQHHG